MSISRTKTLINARGEYKDALQPPTDAEKMEDADIKALIQRVFVTEELRFGDVHLPDDLPPGKLRYLLAKNLAKAAAKELIKGINVVGFSTKSDVYALLTENLTLRLLDRPDTEVPSEPKQS